MTQALGGVLIDTGIGPLADGGLDETFGFAIGSGGVDASADVFDLELTAGLGEPQGAETGAVVGHEAADADAEPGEVSDGLAEKVAGGNSLFIGEHGGEGDTGVVVNGDIEKLPTGSAGFVLWVSSHAMSGFVDAGQFLDVDMQQVPGSSMFVAQDGNCGLQHACLVQFQPSQNAADGGTTHGRGLGDPYAGPALTPQAFD